MSAPFSWDFAVWRAVCKRAVRMTTAEELAELDREWDQISSYVPESTGTFGHPSDRRLGLRVPTACWALVKDRERSMYARTVELSSTGVVLKLLDGADAALLSDRRFDLDIFVPGATRPVHAVASPIRTIGQLQAFEFSTMSSADRLTLAEHLDQVIAARPIPPQPAEPVSPKPPVSWKNFIQSLKRPVNGAAPAQRF